MESVESLQAELAALTRRVEALEGTPIDDRAPVEPADPLWVLEGIKRRHSAPGAIYYSGAVHLAAGPVEWQIGMPVERVLEEDWGLAAASLASLGNPVRLSLLQAVVGGAGSVSELSAGEGVGTTGQLYHHLNQLVAQGWLFATGRGHYAIPPEKVVPLLVILTAARRAS